VTPGQYLFTLEWFAHDFNGTQAWLRLHPNCQEASARVQAAQTLALPNVKALIRRRFEQVIGPLEASATEMAARIGAASRFDPADLFDEKNRLLPMRQWPISARMALKSVAPDGKVTFESRVTLARLVFELEGRLKNPNNETGDVLADALRQDLERHGRHM